MATSSLFTRTVPLEPVEAGDECAMVLASVLEQVVARNDRTQPAQLTLFHALRPPPITIRQYVERLHRYVCCSNECFILTLIFMDRIIQRNPDFFISSLNIHRLLVCGMMLAAKFYDDTYFNNAFYARVGGVTTAELNNLEVEFLFMINFSLHVETAEYERYRRELQAHAVTTSSSTLPAVVKASVDSREDDTTVVDIN